MFLDSHLFKKNLEKSKSRPIRESPKICSIVYTFKHEHDECFLFLTAGCANMVEPYGGSMTTIDPKVNVKNTYSCSSGYVTPLGDQTNTVTCTPTGSGKFEWDHTPVCIPGKLYSFRLDLKNHV